MNYLAIEPVSTISRTFDANDINDAKEIVRSSGQDWYDDGADDLDVPVDGDLEAKAEAEGWRFTGIIVDDYQIWK